MALEVTCIDDARGFSQIAVVQEILTDFPHV